MAKKGRGKNVGLETGLVEFSLSLLEGEREGQGGDTQKCDTIDRESLLLLISSPSMCRFATDRAIEESGLGLKAWGIRRL